MKRRFEDDHNWETEQYKQAWFPTLMADAFPDAEGWRQEDDPDRQRAGVDIETWGTSNHEQWTYAIDFKWRREYWPDILVEVTSNDQTGTGGWAVKDQLTDYLAYMWVSVSTGYFIPFKYLQAALLEHGDDWLSEFGEVTSDNAADFGDYTTHNLPIPIPVMLRNVPNCFRVRWENP